LRRKNKTTAKNMISNNNITRFLMGNQIQHGKLIENRKFIHHSFDGSLYPLPNIWIICPKNCCLSIGWWSDPIEWFYNLLFKKKIVNLMNTIHIKVGGIDNFKEKGINKLLFIFFVKKTNDILNHHMSCQWIIK
jgi:hypothetical protein